MMTIFVAGCALHNDIPIGSALSGKTGKPGSDGYITCLQVTWNSLQVLRYLFSLSILFFAACGDDSDSEQEIPPFTLDACLMIGEKVFGGTECFPGTSPVVRVELVNSDTSTSLCSGTVIGQHAVLTAAHCFLSDVVTARVFAGGQYASVASYVLHPQLMIGENEKPSVTSPGCASAPTNPPQKSHTSRVGYP